jgi:lipoprotein-releasing system permease protein
MGVGALIIALALSNGFRDEMRDKILQGTAHISVLRSDGLPLDDYAGVSQRIRSVEGIVNSSSTTYDAAVARGPKGAAYSVLRGIERNAIESSSLNRWTKEGTVSTVYQKSQGGEPNAVIGSELATRLGVSTNDVVTIVPANSNAGPSVATHRIRIVGVFRSGLFEYDSTWIYLPLETVNAFGGATHAASVVSVQVADADEVKKTVEKLKAVLGNGYHMVDWQDANQPLFSALALERRMGLVIIGLIILISTLNITTMLILVVVERRRDIAILNALGASRRAVMLVFVIEGAVVGAIGALSGVVIGVVGCALGNYFKVVSLPPDVYSISNVPLNSHGFEIALTALLAFVLSVIATLYPSGAAAKMRPVETLRDSV